MLLAALIDECSLIIFTFTKHFILFGPWECLESVGRDALCLGIRAGARGAACGRCSETRGCDGSQYQECGVEEGVGKVTWKLPFQLL